MLGVFAALYDNEAVEGADVLVKYETITIPCKEIKVHKQKLKKLAKLPKSIITDPSLYLTALIRTPNDGHTHKVSAVYDSKDGAVTLLDYQEPLKWLDFNKSRYMVMVDYGLISSDVDGVETGYQVGVRYNRLAVKGLNIGVAGNYRSDKSAMVSVGLDMLF